MERGESINSKVVCQQFFLWGSVSSLSSPPRKRERKKRLLRWSFWHRLTRRGKKKLKSRPFQEEGSTAVIKEAAFCVVSVSFFFSVKKIKKNKVNKRARPLAVSLRHTHKNIKLTFRKEKRD